MTDGDRLPPEPSGDSPFGSHYYGPFGAQQGLSFEAEPAAWHPPLPPPQPLTFESSEFVPPPPPDSARTGSAQTGTPEAPARKPRSAALLIIAAAATALLVGGGAGYGGALLAGRGTDRDQAAPSASVQSSAPAPTTSTGGPSPGASVPPAAKSGQGTVEVANAVLSSTVMIEAGDGTGSGFVFDGSGRIMTNNHVVAAAGGGRLRVVLANGRRVNATIVGRSPSYDLAVIQVKTSGLKPLVVGDSRASRVGEPVIAVGSPLGLAGTVTSGIVSARDRPVVVQETENADAPVAYINAIQTDAPINPGNSGGPLVDSSARVIGVNSAILTLGTSRTESGSIGLGFAIPINQAAEIGKLLIKNGKATYPILGAKVEQAGGDNGVILTAVDSGGPAADAGLRKDDVITRIDGKRVNTVEELIVTIRTHRPGDAVVLDYARGEVRGKARVVLGSKEG
jgi:putative serine protease PepD